LAIHQPFQIIGYHSCDRDVGLRVLNGEEDLIASDNDWDWLAGGVYFWEQNPNRALEYAIDVASEVQFSKGNIKNPFVLGAIIDLGNCLNLVESHSLSILVTAYNGLKAVLEEVDKKLPKNKDSNRKLDCAVIRYVHQSRKEGGEPEYESIRSAFDEGTKVYPDANFASRNHIQVCVINTKLIKGYFLPTPIEEYNPYLKKDFIKP
jgi:hypothetical protein